jgi:hypothetical protein
VQGLKWNPFDGSGEMEVLASVKCETRSAAVSTARQLLAEHVGALDEDTAIEAKVISELDEEAEGLKA